MFPKGAKNHIVRNIFLAVLPALVVFGLVFSANTYYDLDLGKVVIEEITRIVGQLETTATTTLATSAGYVGIGTSSPATLLSVYGTSTFMGGNVGIGTTTPASPLTIDDNGGGSVPALLITGGGGGNAILRLSRDIGGSGILDINMYNNSPQLFFNAAANEDWSMGLDVNDSNKFKITRGGTIDDASTFIIDILGNLGLSTSSPAYTLDVYGNARLGSSTASSLFFRGLSNFNNNFYIDTSGNVATGTWQGTAIAANYGGTGFTSYSRGDILFATTTTALYKLATGTEGQVLKISSGIPAWAADTAISRLATTSPFTVGYIPYATSTSALTDSVLFQTNNNLGIGTTTPIEKLNIYGNLRLGLAPATYSTTSEAIGSASTTIPVISTTGYPSSGTLLIDSEAMTYATTTATAFGGVARGVLGTATSTHAANTTVKNYIFTALATSITPRMLIAGDGSVRIHGGAVDYNADTGTLSADSIQTGPMAFDSDAGIVSWVDLPVASSSTGTVMSYTAQIDSQPVLTIYGTATSTNSIENLRVGIGTTTPNHLLTVGKSTDATSTYALGVYGSIRATGSIDPNQSFDIAERFPIDPKCQENNNCPEVGDLVSVTDNLIIKKSSISYDSKLIGIAVENSAITMGGLPASSSRAVALAGRLPVKVSRENGPIAIGDLITSASSTPGVAMKAKTPGRVIGLALESYDSEGVGQIIVFVNPHWSIGHLSDEGLLAVATGTASTTGNQGSGILDQFTLAVRNAMSKLGLLIENGIARVQELFAQKVVTNQICLDGGDGEIVCINKNQLKDLLQKGSAGFTGSSVSGGGSGASSASELEPAPESDPEPELAPEAEIKPAPIEESLAGEPQQEPLIEEPAIEKPAPEEASEPEPQPEPVL